MSAKSDKSKKIISDTKFERAQTHLHTQFEVSQILSHATSFEEVTSDLLKTICVNLGFSAARLWEVETEIASFQCLASWIDKPKSFAAFKKHSLKQTIPFNSGIPGQVRTTRKPVWIENFSIDPEYKMFPDSLKSMSRRHGLKGAISLPILVRSEVKGVITFARRQKISFNPEILNVLNSIANQIGQFLERREQEANLTRLNRIYTVLSGIKNSIVHIHDRDRLFQNICDIVITNGNFRMVWIGLLDDSKIRLSSLSTGGQKDVREFLQKLGNFLCRRPHNENVINAINNAQPIISNYLESNKTIPLAKNAVGLGCHSAAAFPLKVNNKPEGLIVIYAAENKFFDDDEILLLKELASDISFAMQYIHNEEKLKFLAYHDPLTGLKNRTALYALLEETVLFNREDNKPFALLLININNFRDINDTLGHHTGDELIKAVSKRLSSTVWKSDTVACLGGDDFAILLHRLSSKQHISIVVNKIIKIFKQSFFVSEIPVNVDVTIGIALFPDHGDSAEILWQHADVALRVARRNIQTHLFYDKNIDHYDPLILALVGELGNAIDDNQLVLHYQPKINLLTNKVTGIEALIRWDHPERGLIFPDNFIPQAEQTELINPMTIWVLENAMQRVLDWHNDGYPLELSVNLSARNLQDEKFIKNILKIINKLNFPLDKLLLEITETAIMTDPVHAGSLLAKLDGAGIQLSIDDFGIGQSSLTYLKDLPLKNMKIDKSFVIEINKQSNFNIIRSAIELGHNMKFDVTAEGIEDEKSLTLLRKINCNYGQGYYICKPLPAEKLCIWLIESEWSNIKN